MKKICLSLMLAVTLILSACGQTQPSSDDAAAPSKQEQKADEKEAKKFLESISAETATYKGVCGPDATWYWQDNVLVIKGSGEVIAAMWLSPDESWRELSASAKIIQSTTVWVVIEDGITNIPEGAFGDFSFLTKVQIPNTVTHIGDNAFMETAITSIEIPDSVTTIGYQVFGWCNKLTSVIIPDSVTAIDNYAFYGCELLESLSIPQSVITIGSRAFEDVPHIYYNGTAEDTDGDNWGAKARN